MSQIIIDKSDLMEQLRFDLAMIHSMETHIRKAVDDYLEDYSFGGGELLMQSLRWNQHCRELYRSRVVAVLELIGAFNEANDDTTDTEHLEKLVDALESQIDNP